MSLGDVVLIVVVRLEALAVATGGALGVRAIAEGDQVAVAVFLVVCALLVAVLLLRHARSLRRGSSAGRGFAATWQVLQGATAVTLLAAGAVTAVSWIALGVSVLGLALVVTRRPPPPREL